MIFAVEFAATRFAEDLREILEPQQIAIVSVKPLDYERLVTSLQTLCKYWFKVVTMPQTGM